MGSGHHVPRPFFLLAFCRILLRALDRAAFSPGSIPSMAPGASRAPATPGTEYSAFNDAPLGVGYLLLEAWGPGDALYRFYGSFEIIFNLR